MTTGGDTSINQSECPASKAPYTEWGVPDENGHIKDYLLKDHGPRGDYDNTYWQDWERACPSVRNGKCCDEALGNCCVGVSDFFPLYCYRTNNPFKDLTIL